jgi:hypothetical protein
VAHKIACLAAAAVPASLSSASVSDSGVGHLTLNIDPYLSFINRTMVVEQNLSILDSFARIQSSKFAPGTLGLISLPCQFSDRQTWVCTTLDRLGGMAQLRRLSESH